jgi:hypothetical protein
MYAPEKEVHEYLRSRWVSEIECMLCFLPCSSVVRRPHVMTVFPDHNSDLACYCVQADAL